MGTGVGSYVAGGNAEGLPLPSAPRERTPEEIAEWRARNEMKSAARPTGIVRRTDQTPPPPPPDLEPVVNRDPAPTPQPKPKPIAPPTVDPKSRRNAAIVTAYVEGDTIPDIARARGLGTRTVREIVNASGVPKRDDRKTRSGGKPTEWSDPALADRIGELAAPGDRTAQEIADQLGMSKSTLSKIARRNDITFAHQIERETERVQQGFASYRDELVDAGATSALLRAFATATGMQVGQVGIPGRKILSAWIAAGKPDHDAIDRLRDDAPTVATAEPEPDAPDLARALPVTYTDVAVVAAAADQLGSRELPAEVRQREDGRTHLVYKLDGGLLPPGTAKAITDILDLIELARLANAQDLKRDLEAAGGRILRATVCPFPGTQR